MAGLDFSSLCVPETDLFDITLDGIFLPDTGHGVLVDLGLYDIGLLMSGAPIIEPSPAGEEASYKHNSGLCYTGGYMDTAPSSDDRSSVEDLLSAACKAADISSAVSDNPTVSILSPRSPRAQSTEGRISQEPLSPVPFLASAGVHTPRSESHELGSSSPSSNDSGYLSFSSSGEPDSPESDPDFPMPVSPTPSCFDEPMPEVEAPLKPSRPGSVPVKKPTENYIALIGKAILSAPGRRMILSDIINYILQEFPYYRTAPATWKTAIRHNLSVNDCFVKNGKADSGRGYYWSIHRACMETFLKGDFRRSNARRLVQLMQKARATAMKSGVAARNNGQSIMAISEMHCSRLPCNLMTPHLYSSYNGLYSPTTLSHSSIAHPTSSRGGHTTYPHHSQETWSTQPTGYRYPNTNQESQVYPKYGHRMMTSSNGNIFRVTGPLCVEFTGDRWIPRTKASDAELWCFIWSAPE